MIRGRDGGGEEQEKRKGELGREDERTDGEVVSGPKQEGDNKPEIGIRR